MKPPLEMLAQVRASAALFCGICLVWLSCGGLASAAPYNPPSTNRVTGSFNADWLYLQGDPSGAQAVGFDDTAWAFVGLPHTTKLVTPEDSLAYIGVSWYRKHFTVPTTDQGRKVFIQFGAAMQVADVWVNGVTVVHHEGGYTPFTADVTSLVNYGTADNVIAVRLDSTPNANWAPGKSGVDFQYHGGLYRDVTLTVTDPLHVTDAVYANQVASGGVFVTEPTVTAASATLNVQTHVFNEAAATQAATVLSTLVDANGNVVQTAASTVSIPAGSSTAVAQTLTVASPNLWHPYNPYLYTLHTVIQNGTANVDYVKTTVGIRRIQWTHAGGLTINGSPFKAHGADYHQDIYLLGNAMPSEAIYNDVQRIKNAGMDFVRGSHYPHNPAFYDACDQLGVLVMDSITGWQNYNDTTAFKNNTYQECQDMIRRDRNHPCVVVWETSLNESSYTTAWAQTIHGLAHAEYPGDQMYTAGWATSVFDIYCASSQSGVRSSTDPRPILIDEYGSWDYGGVNTTSAVARQDPEAALLQQCTNITQSLNSNLAVSWFSADGFWVFGDYCGYTTNAPNESGVVDFYRLPKFSYSLFQSQRDPSVVIPNVSTGPMVRIANEWQPGSTASVRVFSNCQQVALYLNNTLVALQFPDTTYPNLPHPPFTFNVGAYTPGTLRAEGRIGGVTSATDTRSTPGTPAQIVLRPEGSSVLAADGGDARLVFIDVVDANGQVVLPATNVVNLAVTGPGAIVGPAAVTVKAGQLATWVQAGRALGTITLTATGSGLSPASVSFTTGAVPGVDPLSLPAAPSGLAGTALNAQVNLAWTVNSSNATRFLVEHSADGVTFTPAVTVGASAATASFTETGTSGTYYYRVSALNGAGSSAPSNVVALNLSVPPTATAWSYADVGSVGATGSAAVSSATGSSVVTVKAAGADIWTTADAFGLYSIQRTGDFEMVAHVASVTKTASNAKAGIMIRESLAANSTHALADITPTTGAEFIWRASTGGSASSSTVASARPPQWLRLVRSGNNFTAFYSANGTAWTALGSAVSIPMATTVYVGLAVTSHASGTLCTGTFDSIRFTQNGWTDADIGAVNILGNGVVSSGSAATQASGADIWNSADAFHYVYQPLSGNFAVSAQVTALSGTNGSSKAGVMIRNTLDSASACGLVDLTPNGIAEFIYRTASATAAVSSTAAGQAVPKWVRLVRVGNALRGFVSPDGIVWTQVGGSVSVPMNSQVYLGLAATNRDNSGLSAATYAQVAVEPPGSVGFLASASSVSETAGMATISVGRAGGTVGPVSVNYTTVSGGTAFAGTNYGSVSGTLNWADGDTAVKSFTVPIYNDNVSGPNRTVALSLSSPAGGATLGTASQWLTIVENPTQNWRFAKFGANANTPSISGDLADPDGGGIPNLIEYALSMNPNNGVLGPLLTLSFVSGGWRLDFKRNALANDVTLTVEQSSDLAQWSSAVVYGSGGWTAVAPGATVVESAVSGSGVDQSVGVTVTIPDLSAGATPRQFFHLKVSRP